jgi:hypothetical protein
MPLRDRQHTGQPGLNMYVPAMNYASALVHGQPTVFSLGTPAAKSANNIAAATAANAVAGTIVSGLTYVADSPYGRSVRLTLSGDPGNAVSIDLFGADYLGQPMVERFTGASGSTAILYGKKAFYRVLSSKVVTAATNAVTWAIGTGDRLGLPYKGDVEWAKEAGIPQLIQKRDFTIMRDVSAADVVAGGSSWIESPCPGFVKTILGIAYGGGGGANSAITAKLATVAIIGLTATPVNATGGSRVTGVPTTAGYNANNRLVKGTLIELPYAAAAAGKGQEVGVEITPTNFSLPDLTDPQTPTTGDPRGTYEPMTVPNGATLIEVGLVGDNSVNSSGNGGLHGIRHVIA